MDKPKPYQREVLYRSESGAIEVVLLTKRTSQGCTHNVYLRRAGQRAGPSMFLGFTTESDCGKAHDRITDLIKASATAAMLHCWQTIYEEVVNG
jgi:hypothetical protein